MSFAMFSNLTKKPTAERRSTAISSEQAAALMTQRRWPEAARAFRKLLASSNDPGLWMQYGHALKESGFFDAAYVAYLKAGIGEHVTQDFYLQLGHLQKITGQFNKAIENYIKARDYPAGDSLHRAEIEGYIASLTAVREETHLDSDGELHIFFSCASRLGSVVNLPPDSKELGRANYSYSFAMRGFQRAADELGIRWTFLSAPHYVANVSRLTRSRHPIHLGFYPPAQTRLLKGAHNIMIFAWEFPALVDEAERGHAFSNPNKMLDCFEEVWVLSAFAKEVVRRYTKRDVLFVPSPILPSPRSGAASPEPTSPGKTGSPLRDLRRVEWVPLSIFPLMQPNFDSHAVGRRRRLHEIVTSGGAARPRDIYLTIFNPYDPRKQIRPLIEGFLEFVVSVPSAILLIKTVSPDDTNGTINRRILQNQLSQPEEFLHPLVSESVWITNATLTASEMTSLFSLATFYICTSYCEGQNLPMLEAMREGVVPVSVCHTAMSDYVSTDNAVVIPHTDSQLPHLMQHYRLWGQSANVVSPRDVAASLLQASELEFKNYRSKSESAAQIVRERYGSSVLLHQLARLVSRRDAALQSGFGVIR